MKSRARTFTIVAAALLAVGSVTLLAFPRADKPAHARAKAEGEAKSAEIATPPNAVANEPQNPAPTAEPSASRSANRRSEFQIQVIARADEMLEPSERKDEQDAWLTNKAKALTTQEGRELFGLAIDRSTPYPARFLSVTLLAGASIPERAELLAQIAESPLPSLTEAHLSHARSHEHIVRKIAIDALAQAQTPDESATQAAALREVASRQADPRLSAYSMRMAALVSAGRVAQARQREDDFLAQIAAGGSP